MRHLGKSVKPGRPPDHRAITALDKTPSISNYAVLARHIPRPRFGRIRLVISDIRRANQIGKTRKFFARLLFVLIATSTSVIALLPKFFE